MLAPVLRQLHDTHDEFHCISKSTAVAADAVSSADATDDDEGGDMMFDSDSDWTSPTDTSPSARRPEGYTADVGIDWAHFQIFFLIPV